MRAFLPAFALLATTAHAQDANVQRAVVFFVPELDGAVTLGVEARSAIERPPIYSGLAATPTTAVLGHLGYRRYLEPHTRLSLGAYVAGGVTADEAGRIPATHIDFGLSLQTRAVSVDFFYWSLGAYGELGPVIAREPSPQHTGLRWAAGVETGPGVLWYLDPWLLGDVVGRVGVQSVTAAGGDVFSLYAGLRLTFDLAHR